jgi:hypothetical protein
VAVLNYLKIGKVCQSLAADRWLSPGTPVSSTNKTDRHDITEILLKVALNTTTLCPTTVLLFGRGETRVVFTITRGYQLFGWL